MTQTTSTPLSTTQRDARRAFLRVALLLIGVNTLLILTTALTAEKLNFLYKDRLGLDADGAATLGILLLLPSYLRPFLGGMADVYPLWGWHRRSYFVLATALRVGGFTALALMPRFTYAPVAAAVITALTGVYLRLVIVEAISVRVGNRTGTISQLQTIQWLVPSAGTILFGAHLSGYVTQHWTYHACFRDAALCALLALPLVFLIDEHRAVHAPGLHETPEARAMRRAEALADRRRTGMALRQGLGGPGLWPVIAFVFALQLAPRPGTAQFYYMVNGLHFSPQFLGDLGAWNSTGEIIGIVLYGLLAPRLPVRLIVSGTVALAVALYAPLFWLRGPHSAQLTGLATSIAGILVNLSISTIAARACPPRIEAMVFGLVMAASTLGGALSNKIGASLYVDFSASAGGNLTHGWDALLLIGMAAALLCAFFLPFLPPWTKSRFPLQPRPDQPIPDPAA